MTYRSRIISYRAREKERVQRVQEQSFSFYSCYATMPQRNKYKALMKTKINLKLKSLLPRFNRPPSTYAHYFLNRTTSMETIDDLIEWAQQTNIFTLDTEHDIRQNRPALIQIEFVHDDDDDDNYSIVILVETCHLPMTKTKLFERFQYLFQIILSSTNIIQTWGSLSNELDDFLVYDLFKREQLCSSSNINVQVRFQLWFERSYGHDYRCQRNRAECLIDESDNDESPMDRCSCLHRPYRSSNMLWSLQMAIAFAFGEWLDKTHTKSRWSLGLDRRLQNQMLFDCQWKSSKQVWLPPKYFKERHRLAKLYYAMNDCFSVTELAKFIRRSKTSRCSFNEMKCLVRSIRYCRREQISAIVSKSSSSSSSSSSSTTDYIINMDHVELQTIHERLDRLQQLLNDLTFDEPEFDHVQYEQLWNEQQQLHRRQKQYLQNQYRKFKTIPSMKDIGL